MEEKNYKASLFYLILMFLHSCSGDPAAPTDCEKPQLELQVSPVKKMIQIFWNFHKEVKDGWIGVYSQEPDYNDPGKNRVCDPIKIDKPMGWSISCAKAQDISKIHWKFSEPTILGFYACAWRKNNGKDEAFIVSDMRTYPRWMQNYWENIRAVPINMIFLPGTHDSISYQFDDGWSWKNAPLVSDQSYSQDSTIQHQLLMGIRYLDLRVKRDGNEYYGFHGPVKMAKLDVAIGHVIEFVQKTEKEIVIFDIHQLSGVSSEDEHRNLANYVKQKFTVDNKQLYVSPRDFGSIPWTATLEQILAKGRVIVAYINVEFQRKDDCGILWPKVYQYWGDKRNVGDLEKYIYENIPGRVGKNQYTDRLTAIMAELTANTLMTIFLAAHGLNDQAEENDERVQQWFLDPKIGMDTNVVAVDFFRSSGIVRIAFMWNERKFFKTNNCDPKEKFSDEYYQKILINI